MPCGREQTVSGQTWPQTGHVWLLQGAWTAEIRSPQKLRWGRGEFARGAPGAGIRGVWRWPPDGWSVHMQILTHRGYAKTRLGRSALVISPTPVIAAACRESLIVLSNAPLTAFLIVVFVAVGVEFGHRFLAEQLFEDCPSARDATHEPAEGAHLVPASGVRHLLYGEV